MTPVQLLQAKCGVEPDGAFGPKSLKAAAKFFKLTNEQTAHFFGQCHHESGGFRLFEENLNYSAGGLLKIFPKYFNQATATAYARQPMRIANKVYANRMGNGDEDSGDGWRYRGRGAIQLTGMKNYSLFGKDPDSVATEFAFESAFFFFDQNKLWTIANTVSDASILALTKRINGGTHGLDDRVLQTKKFYKEILK
jgi:putative chitinase